MLAISVELEKETLKSIEKNLYAMRKYLADKASIIYEYVSGDLIYWIYQ
jgi:hypothetical protein